MDPASDVSNLYGQVATMDQNTKSPVDIYNAALNSLGIADARTNVNNIRTQLTNTEGLLKNVGTDVQARTQDFNVSNNQRDKLIATESQPLAEQVGTFNTALQGATANVNDIEGQGKTQADLTYQGEQAQRSALMDRLKIAIDSSNSAEDKRRWQAEYDRQSKAADESTRQFNMNYALEQRKAADARDASNKATVQDAQKQTANYILTSGQRGRDGYVAPATYKQLMSEWTNAGWSPKDFNTAFKQYANPTHLKDYGL